MFSKTIIAFFVAVLSISWGQAWVVQMHHKDYKPLHPDILDLKHEYMGPQDDMGLLSPSYENLTNFIFENPPGFETDDMHIFWNSVPVKDFLKKPKTREWFVMRIIQVVLYQLKESCEELEKTISPLIINYGSAPMDNANGINTEENQFDIKVILLEVKSAKLVLQDLQNRMDFYRTNIDVATRLGKKIGGLSVQGLLRYTVSVMKSVRGTWIDWKILSHYSDVAKP
nr:BV-like protein [Cotesia vestalis bracovirus]